MSSRPRTRPPRCPRRLPPPPLRRRRTTTVLSPTACSAAPSRSGSPPTRAATCSTTTPPPSCSARSTCTCAVARASEASAKGIRATRARKEHASEASATVLHRKEGRKRPFCLASLFARRFACTLPQLTPTRTLCVCSLRSLARWQVRLRGRQLRHAVRPGLVHGFRGLGPVHRR